MSTHWFLRNEHLKFRNSINKIIKTAAADLCRNDTSNTLGDEHQQCQHLFTKIYTLMQERQNELTEHLLCCAKVSDPVIELRYYRSRIRKDKTSGDKQFVEKETGADFALTLGINLPGILQAERSVLGQAKVMKLPSIELDVNQMKTLLNVGGPESAAYLLWSTDHYPCVISAENVAAHIRTQGMDRLYPNLFTLGQSLQDFFCDAFIGLWFGKDYDPKRKVIPHRNARYQFFIIFYTAVFRRRMWSILG